MLSFQHLDIQVTGPRAAVFRDAIVELLEMELGSALTPQAGIFWTNSTSILFCTVHTAHRRVKCFKKPAASNVDRLQPYHLQQKPQSPAR